ncbi:MAG: hypothetical protein ACR2QK_17825, partial [Acidimicrobiales bacterium]
MSIEKSFSAGGQHATGALPSPPKGLVCSRTLNAGPFPKVPFSTRSRRVYENRCQAGATVHSTGTTGQPVA